MINYETIYQEANNPELTDNEKDALLKLEEITDSAIRKQFHLTESIDIDMLDIDKHLTKFGIYRKPIIINKWIKMYEEAGWSIGTLYERDSSLYFLEKKK